MAKMKKKILMKVKIIRYSNEGIPDFYRAEIDGDWGNHSIPEKTPIRLLKHIREKLRLL